MGAPTGTPYLCGLCMFCSVQMKTSLSTNIMTQISVGYKLLDRICDDQPGTLSLKLKLTSCAIPRNVVLVCHPVCEFSGARSCAPPGFPQPHVPDIFGSSILTGRVIS